MNKSLTVKELRKALEGVPDELEVKLDSDTGVDQGGIGEIVIEMARRVTYNLPNGQKFSDTGETGVDYFQIYANDVCNDD
ncbi:hypothetical protein [Dielma fastidiosa]|uniref:Uncharacterized protein n=1 Tax=Dielma fastidiosa TaxID=1034346 RepID=A0A318KHW3_9FIRM|nr:hypothetical protein [Dielma fastidiosa]PXX73400.1 hypothetical protein DES51_1393 [Dielma fastidiosa]